MVPGSPAHRKATLGLDLQGGLEVVLKAIPPKGQHVTSSGMTLAENIMRNRVDKLGVSEPEVRKQGADQIVIELAGVKDPAVAAKIIGKTAQLEFYDFEVDLIGPSSVGLNHTPVAKSSLYDLLSDPGTKTLAQKGTPSQWYLFNPKKIAVAGPVPSKQALLATDVVRKKLHRTVPKTWHILPVPENTVVVSCDNAAGNCFTAARL